MFLDPSALPVGVSATTVDADLGLAGLRGGGLALLGGMRGGSAMTGRLPVNTMGGDCSPGCTPPI